MENSEFDISAITSILRNTKEERQLKLMEKLQPPADSKLINMSTMDFFYKIRSVLTLQQFYSYKTLTEILEIPYFRGGHQKDRQLEHIQQFIKLDKKGTKYQVEEIYDVVHINLDLFKNSMYIKDIANVLMVYLFTTGKEVNYLSHQELSDLFKFYNKNYTKYKKNADKLAKELDITVDEIQEFYSRSTTYFRDIIKSAFNSLKNHCIIDYNSAYIILIKNNEGDIIRRVATLDQRLDILSMKYDALKEMGFNSHKELYLHQDKIEEYYKKLNEIMEERHPGWYYVYPAFEIIAPMTTLTKESEKVASQYNLNQMVQDFLQLQAERISEKNMKPDEWLIHQDVLREKLSKVTFINE